MRLVIDRHNINIGDLHNRFETIAGAFDQDRNHSKESHKLYNERILSDLDKELDFLDKLGVSQTAEQLKTRELQKLLNDTASASAQVSALTLKKFKEEIYARK